jgi:Bacterial Ig-like domain
MTLTPSRALTGSTTYSVSIDTSATDVAGNSLVTSRLFSFTTTPPPPSTFGLDLGSLWPILVVVGAAGLIAAFVLLRRRQTAAADEAAAQAPKTAAAAPAKKTEAAIDDVFLLYRDGVLIKHETRRLRPDIDTDILSGMLTAVQAFVKDSFRTEEGELNELTFGEMHILIARGKWLILAAMITGGDVDSMSAQIKRAVEDMEDHHWDQLEEWDGDMEIAKVFAPYVRKLIRGEYLTGRPPSEVTRAAS